MPMRRSAPPRRRKLNAWGFEGVSYSPPRPMRTWLEERIGQISRLYDELSAAYQAGKAENDIPLN